MKKIIRTSVVVSIGVFALWCIAMWQNHKMRFLQTIYPAQVVISSVFNDCAEGSPIFLKQSLQHVLGKQGGVSAQVSYISPAGNQFNCVVGLGLHNGLPEMITPEHMYRYASMTKIVTAAAILQLVQDKKLSLEVLLLDVFPEIDRKDIKDTRVQEIRIAHLLNHEAGFNRTNLMGDPMFLRGKKPWCPSNMDGIKTVQLVRAPGVAIDYSNLGYCLLGAVIERVSGVSYREYIEAHFGVASRGMRWSDDVFYPEEATYDYRFETDYSAHYLKQFDFNALSSSAGLVGSAGGFARLLRDINSQRNSTEPVMKSTVCDPTKLAGCYVNGMRFYKPNEASISLRVHEGYLPGAASIAIIDEYGGITVLTKSGANRQQKNPEDTWVPWFHHKLTEHYKANQPVVTNKKGG